MGTCFVMFMCQVGLDIEGCRLLLAGCVSGMDLELEYEKVCQF